MRQKIFIKEKGSVLSYVLISLLVAIAHSILQFFLFVFYILKLLPVGWGGLVAPFSVLIESFIITLPLTLIVLLFWPKAYFSILRDWKFFMLYLLPLVAVTIFYIAITMPLDGGWTLLDRFFSK